MSGVKRGVLRRSICSVQRLITAGRWTFRALFLVLMVAVFVLGVVMGIGAQLDQANGETVLWGTYTERQCVPALRGCDSIGTWVSDDGRLVKHDIRLDGVPGEDGTARASFQPGGWMGDEENNIVHTEQWSGAKVWFPWALAAMAVGATVIYGVGWFKELPWLAGRYRREQVNVLLRVDDEPGVAALEEAVDDAASELNGVAAAHGGELVEWLGDSEGYELIFVGADRVGLWNAVRPFVEKLPAPWVMVELSRGPGDPNPQVLEP